MRVWVWRCQRTNETVCWVLCVKLKFKPLKVTAYQTISELIWAAERDDVDAAAADAATDAATDAS